MASLNTDPPEDEEEEDEEITKEDEEKQILEKKQVLAQSLWDFTRGKSPETADSLVEQGNKIWGNDSDSRQKLSGLYKQYKNVLDTTNPDQLNTFEDVEGRRKELNETSKLQQQKQDITPTPRGPLKSDEQSSPDGRSSSPPPSSQFSLLGKYDAMQSKPIGEESTLSQRRSLESESGKAMRIARQLARKGFNNAAEKMALFGAEKKMTEPNIRTQAYREQQKMLGQRAAQDEQRALSMSQRAIETQRKWLDRANKELDDPNSKVLENPMFSNLFKNYSNG